MMGYITIFTISIHALREEGDKKGRTQSNESNNFYPRPPRGGRPEIDSYLEETKLISIHALREEGDRKRYGAVGTDSDFYPRPPRGGRHADSVPGADCANISIHALREEGDSNGPKIWAFTKKFLSTPSARRATY